MILHGDIIPLKPHLQSIKILLLSKEFLSYGLYKQMERDKHLKKIFNC
jgi:hypothetical protein